MYILLFFLLLHAPLVCVSVCVLSFFWGEGGAGIPTFAVFDDNLILRLFTNIREFTQTTA